MGGEKKEKGGILVDLAGFFLNSDCRKDFFFFVGGDLWYIAFS